MHDNGTFRMPTTMHKTYCGQSVTANEVVPGDEADCDDCIQALAWEEIDADTKGN